MSQITGTGATCSQFSGGTAQTLAAVHYTQRNGRIKTLTPSGFVYWVRIDNAPAGGNSAVIPQAITTGNFSTKFGLASGTSVYTSSCASVSGVTATATSGNDSFTVQWNAGSAGTYFVALSVSTSSVRNKAVPSPPTVGYQFSTNGVTGSASSINLTTP